MMNISIKKRLVTAFAVVLSITAISTLAPAQASAALFDGAKGQVCRGANLSNENAECDSGDAENSAQNTIQNIVNLLTAIVGIAAVILIIINGFRFITANGDSGSITTARNGIIYSLIGLVIAVFAQVLVRFVLGRI